MQKPVPAEWQVRSPLHRAAYEACQHNMRHKPADCVCCGCHTDGVHEDIPTDHIRVWLGDERCPAERRALERIIASRLLTVVITR